MVAETARKQHRSAPPQTKRIVAKDVVEQQDHHQANSDTRNQEYPLKAYPEKSVRIGAVSV
jgi:hypothetical protein